MNRSRTVARVTATRHSIMRGTVIGRAPTTRPGVRRDASAAPTEVSADADTHRDDTTDPGSAWDANSDL